MTMRFKWRRLGRIFDPAGVDLINGQCGFAQSPQALLLTDRVRVYFSTRTRDQFGIYLSQVAYVDFDMAFREIIDHSRAPVIPLGPLGSFDEHGIFPANIVRAGSKILAYTTGWSRRRSVSVDAAVGLATSSDDGVTFEKPFLGPVLSASLDEPFLVGDAFVAQFSGEYHMWYIHGTEWIPQTAGAMPERVYKISHARSNDGIAWRRSSRRLIEDRLGADECQALPTVVKFAGGYHMWFCFRHATDFRSNRLRGYRIGYAFSEDLVTWRRDDSNAGIEPADEGWDAEMLCYPHVFHHAGTLYMLYNGNEFGRYGFGLAVLDCN